VAILTPVGWLARWLMHARRSSVPSMSESTTTVTSGEDIGGTPQTKSACVMLKIYRWGLLFFLAAGVVQIFLAGLGAFRLLHGAGDPALDPHRMLGFVMAGMAIVILILTLIARARGRAIVGAVLLVFMTSFLQSLLAGLADDHVIFGALHATDGLLILAIPAYLYLWTGRRAA
jgi:Family of unknown function (DUF6220)